MCTDRSEIFSFVNVSESLPRLFSLNNICKWSYGLCIEFKHAVAKSLTTEQCVGDPLNLSLI